MSRSTTGERARRRADKLLERSPGDGDDDGGSGGNGGWGGVGWGGVVMYRALG